MTGFGDGGGATGFGDGGATAGGVETAWVSLLLVSARGGGFFSSRESLKTGGKK
jgi:hypothetical protein